MGLDKLTPAKGGAVRRRKRVGRGPGSGWGKTAARGSKGARSRSGYSLRRGFEGGQMPLIRRIPKRGFHNKFALDVVTVNLRDLAGFAEGTVVTPEVLVASRRLRRLGDRVKVLGDGEVKTALVVQAHAFSVSAKAKIETAGGRAEVLPS